MESFLADHGASPYTSHAGPSRPRLPEERLKSPDDEDNGEERAILKEQRKAEKRRRKEEKAALKAARAARQIFEDVLAPGEVDDAPETRKPKRRKREKRYDAIVIDSIDPALQDFPAADDSVLDESQLSLRQKIVNDYDEKRRRSGPVLDLSEDNPFTAGPSSDHRRKSKKPRFSGTAEDMDTGQVDWMPRTNLGSTKKKYQKTPHARKLKPSERSPDYSADDSSVAEARTPQTPPHIRWKRQQADNSRFRIDAKEAEQLAKKVARPNAMVKLAASRADSKSKKKERGPQPLVEVKESSNSSVIDLPPAKSGSGKVTKSRSSSKTATKVPTPEVTSTSKPKTSIPPSQADATHPFRRVAVKKSGNKETDADLRRMFTNQTAMDGWLASKWVNLQELKRLEEAGIVSYRKGKFSDDEKEAIRVHLETFKQVHRLGNEELVSIMMAKGRFSNRNEFPNFWCEVAATVPGRPVKYVKDHVKREYDPRARKGTWTKQEDDELLRAFTSHPHQWTKIAVIVDRTEEDVRNRWRDELRDRETKNSGRWNPLEEAKLAKVIKELNEATGLDPLGTEAPWDLVKQRMDGSRTRTQCRRKWQTELRERELRGPLDRSKKLPKPEEDEEGQDDSEGKIAIPISGPTGTSTMDRTIAGKVKKGQVSPKGPRVVSKAVIEDSDAEADD